MKKRIGIAVLILLITTLGVTSAFAAGPSPTEGNNVNIQQVFNQQFRVSANPLEVTIIKYPEYQTPASQKVQLICRVKNHSALIEEITYDLKSNYGLGGIETVIDYDGPFGPKSPESYNWNKVPVRPGEEQYLYISFPVPSVYTKEISFNLIVNRWLGPRG